MLTTEVLSVLTARSTMFANVGGGRGNSGLSRADFAALLCGLDDLHVRYAMSKYMLDGDSEAFLIQGVADWLGSLARRNGWAGVGQDMLLRLARVAVFESVRPVLCSGCRGFGWNGVVKCKVCDGIGHGRLSGRDVAKAIGVSQSSYVRVWSWRYASFRNFMQEIDNKVILISYKNMRGDMIAI